ncbi:MAG TPA: sugar porter family MFS transporter [Candidatus Paenibacillus intestinavium]|nr:sugar porter family MFS transporter [Candidatus Paenibacillus intestinavium]
MSTQQQTQHETSSLKFVTLISIVAAIGGLLFGFDTAVVSGAIGFMEVRFSLTDFQVGWAVSSLIVGCIVGAGFSGILSDKFGRKKTLIAAAILFIIGSIGSAIPETFDMYIIARIIGGLGIGLTSTICPLYNAEIAPTKYRGRLVALNQLATVTGIFLVYFVNLWISSSGDHTWQIDSAWRWMFGVGVIPGVIFLINLFFVPESPRWLIKKNRSEEASVILNKIHGATLAQEELADIQQSFKEKQGTFKQLLQSPTLRAALFVGVVLAVMQQVTGINAVMYYAPEIFKAAGAGTNAALIQTILVGFINFAFTILAIWLIDRVGRKQLLLVGSTGMALSLIVISWCFQSGNTDGYFLLIFILLYVASFAVSLGPVVWVIISEIFPNHVRGIATAIASMSLWIADYVVSQSFPPLLSSAGPALTFGIFAVLSIFTFFFTLKKVPETRNVPLERIETLWVKN